MRASMGASAFFSFALSFSLHQLRYPLTLPHSKPRTFDAVMSAQVEVAPSEAQALGASPATTIVNTPSQSRAASLKHSDRKSADVARNSHSRSASLADANAAEIEAGTPPVRSKDRAPVFVVALCLFQSLAGLLFGAYSASSTRRFLARPPTPPVETMLTFYPSHFMPLVTINVCRMGVGRDFLASVDV